MEITPVLLLCFFFTDAAIGGYDGFINDDHLRWLEARQACLHTRSSCDLSVQRRVHQGFWDALRLNPGTDYWIGARSLGVLQWQPSGTPLIESRGCFEAPVTLQTTVRPLRYNGPKTCLTQCTGNYVALKNTTCYCLSANQMASLTQRPLEECHTYCRKHPYRCGGDNSRVSVYKIPDRTLFEMRGGKRKDFFWRRTYTNENEYILLTNKPGSRKGHFCVSEQGSYSSIADLQSCPSGSQPLTFENVNIMDFLEATSSMTDVHTFSYRLPLIYSKQPTWMDGQRVSQSTGKGDCTAIRYNGQGYSLVNKRCKDRLPSVCSCYTHTDTTEATTVTTEATTTPTTVTTTTTTATTTTTQTTTQMTTQTTEQMLVTSSTAVPSTSPTDLSSVPSTESPEQVPSEENSTLLFPFHTTNASGFPSVLNAPAPPGQSLSSEGQDTASAASSTEMIIGVSVGAVALVVLVVVVVVVVKRRRTSSSSTLLQDKGSKRRATNYPI